MTVYIYVLSDPRTNEIRYVGKTIRLNTRLRDHLRSHKNCQKSRWLNQLSRSGFIPCLDVVEQFENSNDEDWQESERFWISYLRFIGCNLTNLDTGGIGGKRHAQETNQKIAKASTGRIKSPDERAKISKSKLGWKRPSQHLQATVDYWTGRKHKAETIDRMREVYDRKKHELTDCAIAQLRMINYSLGRGGPAKLARRMRMCAGTVLQILVGARRPNQKAQQAILDFLRNEFVT